VIALCLLLTTAGAQAPSKCRAADRFALAQRANQSTHRRALGNLQSCSASVATPALLIEWQTPPADAITIQLLAKTTGQFRDQRLVDAVMRTVANANLPRDVRVRSLNALISYIDQHSAAIFRRLDEDGLSGPAYVLLGSVDHVPTEIGAIPFRASAAGEIVEFLATLHAKDKDTTVRTVAGYLVEYFRTTPSAARLRKESKSHRKNH